MTAPARSRWLPWLSYLLLWPAFGLATAAFGTIALLASLFDASGRLQHRIARAWGTTVLRIAVSPVRLVGAENLRGVGPAVYAANHLSYMDTPVILSKLPFQFRILARHELFRIPFIGWYLRRSGQIAVDSTSLRANLASLNRGADTVKRGMSLVLFPEGGRSADGRLQPFHSGAAIMAIRAQAPLVPLALIGTYELMPMHTYHLHPRPLLLVVGKPIPTTGCTTRQADQLLEQVVASIHQMFAQHSGSSIPAEEPSAEEICP
jgi:1-acyl-sn-glycerol-3-phosphate acyltransferase